MVFTGERANLSGDARQMLDAWLAAGGEIHPDIPESTLWDAVIMACSELALITGKEDLTGQYFALVNKVTA